MKKIGMLFIFSAFFIPSTLHADIYMKASAANGLGTTETWTSGKKQRSMTTTSMAEGIAGAQIQIIRADKGVTWDIDEELKSYQETPIPLAYTPPSKEDKLTPEEEKQKDQFYKQLDSGTAAADADPCSQNKKSGERVIAGMQAEGFDPACPDQGLGARLWVARVGEAKAEKIQKEIEVFEKAHQDSMYSLYPPKEKEEATRLLNLIGKAMAQGMMGMANTKNMPQRLILGMETIGAATNEEKTVSGMLYEVVEAEQKPADASLFEVPEGYTKVANLGELRGQQLMARMTSGELKMSDVLGSVEKMGAQLGVAPVQAEPGDEENKQLMDSFGQAVMQGVKEEAQMQGNSNPAAGLRQQFPKGQDEAWQQGLYDQRPPAQNAPAETNYQQPPLIQQQQGYVPPAGQQRRRPQPSTQKNTQQTLQQVNQMLQSIQGIAATFQGGGSGLQGLPGMGGDYGDYQSGYEGSEDSGYYEDNSYYEEPSEEYTDEQPVDQEDPGYSEE